MNRYLLLALAGLMTGMGGSLPAQETNSAVVLDWSVFQSIAQKNIFDPSRSGRGGRPGSKPREVVVRYFNFNGTIDDTAIFTGEGAPERGYVKVGDLINGFKVMKITLHQVQLAEPNGNLLTLVTDDSMKREDEGPWTKSDQPAPLVISPAAATPGDAPSPAAMSAASSGGDPAARYGRRDAAGGNSAAEILKRLRQKREQEEK